MNQPPPGPRVAQFLRKRFEWAIRFLIYFTALDGGSHAVCAAAFFFALDALLVRTQRGPGVGRDSSYVFLRSIVADTYTDRHSYQDYFTRAGQIQALHRANRFRDAGLRLYNAICANNKAAIPLNFEADARVVHGVAGLDVIRRASIPLILARLDERIRSAEVDMAQISPVLTMAQVSEDWTRPLFSVSAGTLEDTVRLPFPRSIEKPFNGVTANTVMLYDTVIEHRLHYERVLDPNDELGERGFECVIVPLISGLRIAIFKPVASALADVLRFGAERLLLDAIESALSKAAPLVRLEMPEIDFSGNTLAMREIIQAIWGPGRLVPIFGDSDDARLGLQRIAAQNTPLRDIYLRSLLRIRCVDQQPGGSGVGGGAGGSGGDAGGSGIGGGAVQQPGGSGLGGGAVQQPGGSGLGGGASPGPKRGAPTTELLAAVSGQEERGGRAAEPHTAKGRRRRSRGQAQPAAQPAHPMNLRSRADTQATAAEPAPAPQAAPQPPAGPSAPPQHIILNESFCYIVFMDETTTGPYQARHVVFAGTYRRAEGELEATLPDTQPSLSAEEEGDDDGASGSGGKKGPVARRGDGLGGQCGAEVQGFDTLLE
ncbi:hypothetical protein AAVH_28358 [Aphelenchoides avenae]|nr:hypothetical protein AAVH_28358 [Aphelenchus avenae]